MKKSIAMLLSLAMAASLTACGGGSKPAETPAPESTTTAAAADTSEEAKTEAAADGAEDPFAALGDFVMTVGHAQPGRKSQICLHGEICSRCCRKDQRPCDR